MLLIDPFHSIITKLYHKFLTMHYQKKIVKCKIFFFKIDSILTLDYDLIKQLSNYLKTLSMWFTIANIFHKIFLKSTTVS